MCQSVPHHYTVYKTVSEQAVAKMARAAHYSRKTDPAPVRSCSLLVELVRIITGTEPSGHSHGGSREAKIVKRELTTTFGHGGS